MTIYMLKILYKCVGIKCSFLDSVSKKTETFEYQGGPFRYIASWINTVANIEREGFTEIIEVVRNTNLVLAAGNVVSISQVNHIGGFILKLYPGCLYNIGNLELYLFNSYPKEGDKSVELYNGSRVDKVCYCMCNINNDAVYNNIYCSTTHDNYINLDLLYPLKEGVYDFDKAVAAIPYIFRKRGLTIEYHDGVSFKRYQFISDNKNVFLGKDHWRALPYYGELEGKIFAGGQDINLRADINPIIDINIVDNGGVDKIYLSALNKDPSQKWFLIQFSDESGTPISQYINKIPDTFPNGITTLLCSPIDAKNVKIEVTLNADYVPGVVGGLTKKLLIINKFKPKVKPVDVIYQPLKNKTILCFGDSITEFAYQEANYPKHLADLSGANVISCGIGGTRLGRRQDLSSVPAITNWGQAYAALDISNVIKSWVDDDWTKINQAVTLLKNEAKDDNTAIIESLKKIRPENVDIITIFGGTNDFASDEPLGEVGSQDINTVAGGIYTAINAILTANPKIKIYMFSPIVRYLGENWETKWDDSKWSDVYQNSSGKKLPELVEFIGNVAKHFHIPYCNWYWSIGWNKFNFSEYFAPSDGTHPYKGFKYLAEKIYNFILSN